MIAEHILAIAPGPSAQSEDIIEAINDSYLSSSWKVGANYVGMYGYDCNHLVLMDSEHGFTKPQIDHIYARCSSENNHPMRPGIVTKHLPHHWPHLSGQHVTNPVGYCPFLQKPVEEKFSASMCRPPHINNGGFYAAYAAIKHANDWRKERPETPYTVICVGMDFIGHSRLAPNLTLIKEDFALLRDCAKAKGISLVRWPGTCPGLADVLPEAAIVIRKKSE